MSPPTAPVVEERAPAVSASSGSLPAQGSAAPQPTATLQPSSQPPSQPSAQPSSAPPVGEEVGSLKEAVRAETERVERELIQRALDETAGNVTQAARKLQISRKSLQTKMKELGLRDKEQG